MDLVGIFIAMKKTGILLTMLCAAAHIGFAQEVKTDKLIKLNGETLAVKVTAVTERDVSFVYPNEEAVNTISTNQVKEVMFASGRVQSFAKVVDIKGEQDWEKVTITTVPGDVNGLVSKGEITASVMPMTAFSDRANMDAKASEKLKKKAAHLGAHIILLSGGGDAGVGMTVKKGVAYAFH